MTAPPTGPFDVLLVDDHDAFREALALFIAQQPGVGQVTTAGSIADARTRLAAHGAAAPSARLVVLLDLHIGPDDGAQLIPEILRERPGASVVVLSAADDPARLGRVVEAGAVAILSKRSALAAIVAACRGAAEGRVQLDPAVAVELMRAASRDRLDRQRVARVVATISQREREVLQLVAQGSTDREIAEDLHISYDTVRTHVRNTLRKLGVNDRMAGILFGIRHGLINDDRPPGPGVSGSTDSSGAP